MTVPSKELLLNGSSSLKVGSKGNSKKNPPNTMRKFQQLALTIVSVISLVAFLFYKHEYDRLRYTLQYLEMFGSPPDSDAATQNCGFNVHRRLRTTMPYWQLASQDLAIYSVFWDEGDNIYAKSSVLRAIALVKKSTNPNEILQARIWHEGSSSSAISTSVSECSIQKIRERAHATLSTAENELTLVYLLCRAADSTLKTPLAAQFSVDGEEPAPMTSLAQIQESPSWRSVADATAICAFTTTSVSATRNLVEFMAFHKEMGVEKFTFYGNILTPLARKILDKYGDEMGLFYEEFPFNVPFPLTEEQTRSIVEKDCLYRHRDSYENVLVLKLNQFLIPRNLQNTNSVKEILTVLETRDAKSTRQSISEFHLRNQRVCIDSSHSATPSTFKLNFENRLRAVATPALREEGAAIVRPHLSTTVTNEQQHVPASIALILSFVDCPNQEPHSEDDEHLPSTEGFAERIRKSLLYRKWKILS